MWFGTSTAEFGSGMEASLLARTESSDPFYRQTFGSLDGRVLATGLATNGSRLAFAGRFDGSLRLGGAFETPSERDVFLVVFGL